MILAGCDKEVAGQAVSEHGSSVFEGMPPEVNRESWCGYKASQAAIHDLFEEIGEDGLRPGTFKTPDGQAWVNVQKTSIGYAFSNMELHPTGNLVVRGDLSVVSRANTPVGALDTASFKDGGGGTSGIRMSVAAWNLDFPEGDSSGGTSDGVGDICSVAQEIVDATH